MNDNVINICVEIVKGVVQGVFSLDTTKLIVTIISAIIPFLVFILFTKWKDSIIHSLNEYLIHQINPVVAFIAHWGFWIFELCFIPIFVVYSVSNGSNDWLYGIGIFILLICFRKLYKVIINKDRKGLVGLLAHDLKSVSKIEIPSEEECIHFVKMIKDDGTPLSYEERTIIHDPEIIKGIVDNTIVPYFENLRTKMKNRKVFSVNGKNICDFMMEVYSTDNIIKHIKNVENKMNENNSINFIGDKIGIGGYSINKGTLSLDIYMTDHFTFNVFKDIFLDKNEDKKEKEFFQTIIRRTNIVDEKDKQLLIQSLKFLLSSFGIDVVIHGKTANKKKGMLVGLRSGRIEKNGESKLHVPVNETFTKTDIEDNRYCLYECVKRGINEELGIPTNIIDNKYISFHDFALVADQGEIGLGCHVDLSEIMSLEQARLYPGQDKYMEMDNLVIVSYPPFFWNPNRYIDYFYMKSYNDLFCTPWESFTPLLYQRCIVRNIELKNLKKWNSFISLITTVAFFYFYFPDLTNWINFVIKTISASIWSVVIAPFIASLINGDVKKMFAKRILYLKPLLPQWGSDVKVLQATRYSNEDNRNTRNYDINPIASDFLFCIFGHKEKPRKYRLRNLKLQVPPLCKIRRELSDNSESPISFYLFQPRREEVLKSRLYFVRVPVKSSGGKLEIDINVTFDSNNNMTYHFVKPLEEAEEPELFFTNSFSNDLIESFQNLFSISRKTIKNQIRASLDSSFKKRYTPLDLFLYRGNYYWSVFDRNRLDIPKIVLDKYCVVYDDFVKNLKQNTTIRLTGPSKIVAKKISEFIYNNKNRSRISALDIYMLQLALTRLGPDNKGIFLGIEESGGFSYHLTEQQIKIVRLYRKQKEKVCHWLNKVCHWLNLVETK